MTDHQAQPLSGTERAALIVSSSLLAGPIAVAALVGWVLKTANPSNVDVTSDLAYLGPILIAGWSLMALLFVAAVLLNLAASRSGRGAGAWRVFAVQCGLIVIYSVATWATEALS